MKKIYSILLLLFSLINCTSKDYKADLIGDWYLNENPTNKIIFLQESLNLSSIPQLKHKWKADKEKITLLNSAHLKTDSINRLVYYYTLSKNNDTLWINTKINPYKFIKIKNHFKYFQKIINLKIDLKENRNNLESNQNNYLNLNIYVGYENDTLVIKTDNPTLYLGDNFLNETFSKIESVSIKDSNKLKFNLIVDKKISDFQMDSIKTILRKTPIQRIFRVYKNDTIDYKNNLNWYGKYE